MMNFWLKINKISKKFLIDLVAILYTLFVYIAPRLVAVMRYLADISPVKKFISLYISPRLALR